VGNAFMTTLPDIDRGRHVNLHVAAVALDLKDFHIPHIGHNAVRFRASFICLHQPFQINNRLASMAIVKLFHLQKVRQTASQP
jgi:hypothetical protein